MLRFVVGGSSALQAAPSAPRTTCRNIEISEQSRYGSDPTRATRTSQLTHLTAALTKPPDLFPLFFPTFLFSPYFFRRLCQIRRRRDPRGVRGKTGRPPTTSGVSFSRMTPSPSRRLEAMSRHKTVTLVYAALSP